MDVRVGVVAEPRPLRADVRVNVEADGRTVSEHVTVAVRVELLSRRGDAETRVSGEDMFVMSQNLSRKLSGKLTRKLARVLARNLSGRDAEARVPGDHVLFMAKPSAWIPPRRLGGGGLCVLRGVLRGVCGCGRRVRVLHWSHCDRRRRRERCGRDSGVGKGDLRRERARNRRRVRGVKALSPGPERRDALPPRTEVPSESGRHSVELARRHSAGCVRIDAGIVGLLKALRAVLVVGRHVGALPWR